MSHGNTLATLLDVWFYVTMFVVIGALHIFSFGFTSQMIPILFHYNEIHLNSPLLSNRPLLPCETNGFIAFHLALRRL